MKNPTLLFLLFVLLIFGCSTNPHVVIRTNMGEIEIELYPEDAPKHVNNFLKLVNERFYVGTTFHRIVPGFVVQGGDPNSKDYDRYNDGMGGPGYTIPAEIKLLHIKGGVAAARLGGEINPRKRSSGSQFYICLNDLPALDKSGYSVFGQVVKGMEVVEKMVSVKRDENDNPIRRLVMENVYLN
jgi:cyclophilin family peptidyl-prolyl cis-trans isomerase